MNEPASTSTSAPAAPAAETANGMQLRLGGLGLIALGAWLGYSNVYSVIQQMAANADNIEYSEKYVFVTPVMLGLGLILLVLGAKAAPLLSKEWGVGRFILVGLVIALMGGGFFLHEWLEAQAAVYGYST
jgi:hypothetical protein